MAKINVLDPSVYNYIAAGEVVERPASVVKELVENSIDAKSTIIEIEVSGGGLDFIKVSDNGVGIEKEFLKTAFLPHATSKIANVTDLDNILTLGFRGEALASIAAVAKVTTTSKTATDDIASSIQLEAGKVISEHEVGAKTGTTTIVKDLFYCVPARQKFLKKPKSEEQEITNLVARFILAHPEISFLYIADGKTIYSSTGKTTEDAIFSIYGKDAIQETLTVSLKKGNCTLHGYIGRPSFSKPNRTYQTLVINGRYVINQTVATAVTNAFGEMLMKRKYPFYVLYLDIPTNSVDVNVHPNKLDVRFENSQAIYSLFYEAVSRALDSMDYIASSNIDPIIETPVENNCNSSGQNDIKIKQTLDSLSNFDDIVVESKINSQVTPIINTSKKPEKIDKAGVNLNPFSFNTATMSEAEKKECKTKVMDTINLVQSDSVKDGFGLGSKLLERLSKSGEQSQFTSSEYKVNEVQQDLGLNYTIKNVGKAFNTYLIVEIDNDLFFIDQHAAHERLLYEKFKQEYDNKSIVVQPLLFPYVLSLNPLESNIINDNLTYLNELGFEVDEFGQNTYKINAVPAIVSEMNFDSFFSEFLSDSKNIAKKSSDLIKEYLMQHSCKSAIKGGNDLSKNEVEALFKNMGKEKIALFCPHGRPIAIRVSKTEIEKWFKRIV